MIKNPLADKLTGYQLVLASGSPRRQQFFRDLGLDFIIRIKEVDEVYPPNLKGGDIADYLAILKAAPQIDGLEGNEILITSDTVVWHDNASLAKAQDRTEAIKMLQKLSGTWHQVITSVCFTTCNLQKIIRDTTWVKFNPISETEISFYVDKYQPYDKAGAYGIQDWLGAVAIERIEGSYNTVVGLPTHQVYKTLMDMVSQR